MAQRTLHSSNITFLDYTDNRKIDVYLTSNLPTAQIYNVNTSEYSPDWTSTNVMLQADVFLDAQNITDNVALTWWVKDVNGVETQISNTNTRVITGHTLTLSANELSATHLMTYICKATYQGIIGRAELTCVRVDTGLNGADGTGVEIKGTANSVALVTGTNYYTITYDVGVVAAAELGDAYLYNGDLYVCADSRDGEDYFINVGNIQGPAGQDAKQIILNADGQVFKVNKNGVMTPSIITITAYPINTTITTWTYSTNGGQTFLSTIPAGIVRNGNQITITGTNIPSNIIVIKASDGVYSDTMTIYKVLDGTDGVGEPGQSAPIAFLTNENITFNANSSGQILATTRTSNIVAFVGTESVTPTVGTITGLPTGMTVSSAISGNEIILTLTIANNSTLGSTSSNSGYINIPITIPTTPAINTNLILNWSKINAGRSVSSIVARYAVSNSNTTAPTSWQTTMPTRESGQYLWVADYITYDNSTNATVGARVVTGDTGTNGVSVSSIISYFANNQSQTTAPTSNWATSPTRTIGYYTWRKDLITYSDGTTEYTTPVCITGDQGDPGDTGTPASLVQIIASALYFKSTTGKDGIFSPDYIYLYPRFQTVTYTSWQYSINGGATWSSASSANGLTISTYNNIPNTLRISKSSTLYTDTITSISFKCNSNNEAIYDIVSIAKIYDVVDLQVGGRNYLLNTKSFKRVTTSAQSTQRFDGIWYAPDAYTFAEDDTGVVVASITSLGNTTTYWRGLYSPFIPLSQFKSGIFSFCVSFKVTVLSEWDAQAPFILELYNTTGSRIGWTDVHLGNANLRLDQTVADNLWVTATFIRDISMGWGYVTGASYADAVYIGVRLALARNGSISFKLPSMQDGKNPTDWIPAPEDIESAIEIVDTKITDKAAEIQATTDSLTSRVTSTESSIGTINGNVSSLTSRLSTAEQKITDASIVATVRSSTAYQGDLGTKEIAIYKGNTAPSSPINGKLWIDTSVTPNILYRYTGSTWAKVTPTTASEVGAYSATNGSALATRMSTAEQKITADAIVSTVRSSTLYTNDLGTKVSSTEIISKINQTAESVTIQANKIGLLGATNIPNLTANKIQGGTLTLGGSNNANGLLLVKDASTTNIIKIDNSGIKVKNEDVIIAQNIDNLNASYKNTLRYTGMWINDPASTYPRHASYDMYGFEAFGVTQDIGNFSVLVGYDSSTEQIRLENTMGSLRVGSAADPIIETMNYNSYEYIKLNKPTTINAGLTVTSTIDANRFIDINGDTTNTSALRFYNSGPSNWTINLISGGTNAPMYLYDATNNFNIWSYDTNKDFNIHRPLNVSGSANFTGGLNKSGVAVPSLSDFTRSIGNTGYQKLPNGMIIQWGLLALTTVAGANQNTTVTFPIAFTQMCTFASAEVVNRIGYKVDMLSPGTTSATLYMYLSAGGNMGTGISNTIRWFAIGY